MVVEDGKFTQLVDNFHERHRRLGDLVLLLGKDWCVVIEFLKILIKKFLKTVRQEFISQFLKLDDFKIFLLFKLLSSTSIALFLARQGKAVNAVQM